MKLKITLFVLAAILVIIGALFKVMHWPAATLLIELGLGLGVFMLVIELSTMKKTINK
jgi:uncharacterized membrane protein AbrB (regulator of aidB expression)